MTFNDKLKSPHEVKVGITSAIVSASDKTTQFAYFPLQRKGMQRLCTNSPNIYNKHTLLWQNSGKDNSLWWDRTEPTVKRWAGNSGKIGQAWLAFLKNRFWLSSSILLAMLYDKTAKSFLQLNMLASKRHSYLQIFNMGLFFFSISELLLHLFTANKCVCLQYSKNKSVMMKFRIIEGIMFWVILFVKCVNLVFSLHTDKVAYYKCWHFLMRHDPKDN